MKQKHYDVLQRHNTELREAFNSLRTARSLEEASSFWLDFLNAYQKIYFKLKPACIGNNKSKAWLDAQANLLATDELLSYLQQARNAEQHGLEEIVASGGGISFGAFGGHGSYYIKEVVLEGNTNTVRVNATDQFGVPVRAEDVTAINRLKLIPVTNRGVTFQPPVLHKGHKVDPNNVVAIAAITRDHINEMLREASLFIV